MDLLFEETTLNKLPKEVTSKPKLKPKIKLKTTLKKTDLFGHYIWWFSNLNLDIIGGGSKFHEFSWDFWPL